MSQPNLKNPEDARQTLPLTCEAAVASGSGMISAGQAGPGAPEPAAAGPAEAPAARSRALSDDGRY